MTRMRLPSISLVLSTLLVLCVAEVVERTATARKGVMDDPHTHKIVLRMPPIRPRKADKYICTSVKVPNPHKKQYITMLEPKADADAIHHLLLFGCVGRPASLAKSWDCSWACSDKSNIMYSWPRHGTPLVIPKDVGFAIGGDTGIDNLVLQVHYLQAFTAHQKEDTSGLDLYVTDIKQPYIAGIYLLYSISGEIPAHTYKYDMPISCKFGAKVEIHPFAYRTHAHDLATVITGFLKNTTSTYEIGQGDPQLPQAFYPINNKNLTIKPGDSVAAVCSYSSLSMRTATKIGSRHTDEMCNFYMMYYTRNVPEAKSYYQCIENNLPHYIKELMPIKNHLKKEGKAVTKNVLTPPKKTGNYPTVGRNDRQGYDSYHDPYPRYDTDYRYNQRKDYPSDYYNNYDTGSRSGGRNRGYQDYDSLRPEKQYNSDYQNLMPEYDRSFYENGDGQDAGFAKSTLAPINPPLSVKSHAKLIAGDGSNSRVHKTNNQGGGNRDGEKKTNSKPAEKSITLETTGLPPPVRVEFVKDWPTKKAQAGLKLGQVSGVTTAPNGDVIIFHRGSRAWDGTTFDVNNKLRHSTPIAEKTIVRFNKDGNFLEAWGDHEFYLPHGIHMDKKGNLWMTDVGMHQVFRFKSGEKKKAELILGVKMTPGSDNGHFCKPTDVTVDEDGNFYVSDGYCNSRVMKFDHKGKLLTQWGHPSSYGTKAPPANAFSVPHSITLIGNKKEVCVADRENGRVQCFDYNGKFLRKLKPKEVGGRLFAVSYSKKAGDFLYVVNGPDFMGGKVAGFTMKLESGEVVQTWEPKTPTIKSLANPHDIAVTEDGTALYVVEIGPNKIWKFNIKHTEGDTVIPNKTKKIYKPVVALPQDQSDNLGHKTESFEAGDMSASMIIGALLVVPIIIIVIVTIIIRLRKSGKLRFSKNYKNRKSKLNLGSFFGGHRGFDRVSQDESDHELDHLSDSEVEEYTASTQKA